MVRALAAVLSGLIVVCGAAVAAKAPPKKALEERPMRVALVKGAQAGCEPSCPEWIAAQGKIDAEALRQFKIVIGQLGNRRVPVLIHSGGGDMDASLAIGRLLRAKGIDIAVAKTAFITCTAKDTACRKSRAEGALRGIPDDSFSICASACAFVLAAGAQRYVGPWAFIGVHQVLLLQTYNKVLQTYRVTLEQTASGTQRVRKQLIATKIISQKIVPKKAPSSVYDRAETYFAEMGIAAEIMPMLLKTPNGSVHWLTQDELRSTHMATHRLDAEQLLAGARIPGAGWIAGPETGSLARPALDAAACRQLGAIARTCSTEPPIGGGGAGATAPFVPPSAPAH